MKKFVRISLTLIGLIAILAVIQLSPGEAQTRGDRAVKWEYKALTLKDANVGSAHDEWEEKLNSVGQEGWELVSTIPFLHNGNTAGLRVLLKRPLH